MGKSKNRSKSEVEYLRGEVRRLKAELKYYKRRSHIETGIIDEVIEEAPIKDISVSNTCPDCGKGVLQEIDLHFLIVKKCDHCDYKETKKQ